MNTPPLQAMPRTYRATDDTVLVALRLPRCVWAALDARDGTINANGKQLISQGLGMDLEKIKAARKARKSKAAREKTLAA